MEREELLQELRIVLDDVGYDPGWTDPVLARALSEGQDKFCERTGFFVVSTPLPVTTGVRHYALDRRIIEVLDVFDSRGRKLGKFQMDDLYSNLPPGTPHSHVAPLGGLTSWQADVTGRTLSFLPAPAENQTVSLRLWRRSEVAFSDEDEPEMELPEEFQFACIEWAAYRLLRHHDMEKENKVKSFDHLSAFNNYVLAGKQAHRRIMGVEYSVGSNPLYVV